MIRTSISFGSGRSRYRCSPSSPSVGPGGLSGRFALALPTTATSRHLGDLNEPEEVEDGAEADQRRRGGDGGLGETVRAELGSRVPEEAKQRVPWVKGAFSCACVGGWVSAYWGKARCGFPNRLDEKRRGNISSTRAVSDVTSKG